MEELYRDMEFYDDVTGQPLDYDMAVQARKTEMKFFKKMGVYTKVPRQMAKDLGCKVITTRWLDINKGDKDRPNYRARLVGREINNKKRLDLFAATPPLEALKMIVSLCAHNQRGSAPYRIVRIDVRRAYFYAKARRPVFIEIPEEDREHGDEGTVGRLELSLYGTRDAAQNWNHEFTDKLNRMGLKAGRASPCNFVHSSKPLYVTVHGDDFTATGPTEHLTWFENQMKKYYEIESEILGPETGMKQEVSVLNRNYHAWVLSKGLKTL